MGVTVDTRELKAFKERLTTLSGEQLPLFMEGAVKEMANRLLALVIPRTPVGASGKGHVGGTLRRGWTNLQATGYSVERGPKSYTITLTNPVYYASYVEYGHRQTPGRYVPAIGKRLVASWVEGQHFLKISEDELREIAPVILETLLNNFIRTVM